LCVQISDIDALCDAGGIDLDAQDGGVGHGAGERLRAAHSAEPRGEHEGAGEIAAEMALGDPHEDLVGTLNDSLGADVLPVAGGETAPADQILFLQLVKGLGLRPLADQVAIGHEHQRRLGVGPDDADRLARLHDQGLPLVHRLERCDHGVMRGPVAGGATERGVDHEIVRIFAHREHVLQKPQKAFLPPALAAQARARGNGERTLHPFAPRANA
jgi:hypothetical protein